MPGRCVASRGAEILNDVVPDVVPDVVQLFDVVVEPGIDRPVPHAAHGQAPAGQVPLALVLHPGLVHRVDLDPRSTTVVRTAPGLTVRPTCGSSRQLPPISCGLLTSPTSERSPAGSTRPSSSMSSPHGRRLAGRHFVSPLLPVAAYAEVEGRGPLRPVPGPGCPRGRDHGRPLRTGSAPSRRSSVTNLPKTRGLSPVKAVIQDDSDAVITPDTTRSFHGADTTSRMLL